MDDIRLFKDNEDDVVEAIARGIVEASVKIME